MTAGPTREYIDPVRYLSNESSGKQGYEIALALDKLGLNYTNNWTIKSRNSKKY